MTVRVAADAASVERSASCAVRSPRSWTRPGGRATAAAQLVVASSVRSAARRSPEGWWPLAAPTGRLPAGFGPGGVPWRAPASSGCVRQRPRSLVTAGWAVRTHDRPRRYRTADPTEPAGSAPTNP